MALFEKGSPRPAAAGRRKGTPNKKTTAAKDALESVFHKLGGEKHMRAWAEANPNEFYRIWSKLVPTEQTLKGDKDNPLVMGVVSVPRKEDRREWLENHNDDESRGQARIISSD